jgi:hypothetical protein
MRAVFRPSVTIPPLLTGGLWSQQPDFAESESLLEQSTIPDKRALGPGVVVTGLVPIRSTLGVGARQR